MTLNLERLRRDGFLDDEIRQIQEHCEAADKAGRVNPAIAMIWLNSKLAFCCTTVAEIYERLRPGCWLDRPGGKHYQGAMALMRQLRKKERQRKHRPLRSLFKK
jgi:hypothetical protein